uniref:Ammonium transporter AmtB-like domain-containing protein n=1 Tax=Branchiostoma floridae TaxID=7739 RepID=C3Y023_BRAFL|eukprot:XP_002610379.1 hypothetical protein BRAFLDRAFT_72413 [Branchiostoma floridae]
MAWCAVVSGLMFGTLKCLGILRVPPEIELRGLDIPKHGEPAYPTESYGHGWTIMPPDFSPDPYGPDGKPQPQPVYITRSNGRVPFPVLLRAGADVTCSTPARCLPAHTSTTASPYRTHICEHHVPCKTPTCEHHVPCRVPTCEHHVPCRTPTCEHHVPCRTHT